MTNDTPVSSFDLLAYVDGALSPHRQKEVAAWLAKHPDVQQQLEQDMALNKTLKEFYDPTLEEAIPARLKQLIMPQEQPSRRTIITTGWQQAAMAAGVGCLALLAGWHLGASHERNAQYQPLVSKAEVSTQVTPATPITPAAFNHQGASALPLANTEQASQPLNWLTQKVALEIQAPDLSASGYSLTDRRLVSMDNQEAVQMVYKNTQNHELSLFIKPLRQQQAPVVHYQREGATAVAYWEDGPLTYALRGPVLTEAESAQLAEVIREKIGRTTAQPLVDYSKPNDPHHSLAVDVVIPPRPETLQEGPVGTTVTQPYDINKAPSVVPVPQDM